ncbi:hypothetical protein AAHN97_15035 [Chitinophaga niabensis]|uniref:hypothetical protein n=1 Tax=Chitinophaga niabensis TaxID=536979 RepID=UPI0031BB1D8F
MKYFIGTYTNWAKEYCDKQFLENIGEIQQAAETIPPVVIVDNTDPEKHDYVEDLTGLADEYLAGKVAITQVYRKHEDHQFHHNVVAGALSVRQHFLNSDAQYLLLVESDVIPPVDLLGRLDASISQLPEDWGILGCLYYEGFHDYSKTGIHQAAHALSGCTVYRREVVEQYPFRISEENWAAFPDAWISYDVNKDGKFKIFNDHDIRCEHLHYRGPMRQCHPL